MIIIYAEDTERFLEELVRAFRGIVPIQVCDTAEEAKDFAENFLGPGDSVLICTPSVNEDGDGRKLSRELIEKGSRVLLLEGADVKRHLRLVLGPIHFDRERILQIREMVG